MKPAEYTEMEKQRVHQAAVFFLQKFADFENVLPIIHLPEEWPTTDDVHRPLGFFTPAAQEMIEFHWCPVVMVRSTLDLSDREYGVFLTYVLVHTQFHILYLGDDYSPGELELVIDDAMLETFPGLMMVARDIIAACAD